MVRKRDTSSQVQDPRSLEIEMEVDVAGRKVRSSFSHLFSSQNARPRTLEPLLYQGCYDEAQYIVAEFGHDPKNKLVHE